jgi:hypothetical protein
MNPHLRRFAMKSETRNSEPRNFAAEDFAAGRHKFVKDCKEMAKRDADATLPPVDYKAAATRFAKGLLLVGAGYLAAKAVENHRNTQTDES